MKKILTGVALIVVLFLAFLGFRVVHFVLWAKNHPSAPKPGEAKFKEANNKITLNKKAEGTAFGNDKVAIEMAAQFSKLMKTVSEQAFTGGHRGEFSMTQGEFLTYCHHDQDKVVFLAHVPELRQYVGEVRDVLSKLSWAAAQGVVQKSCPDQEIELGVGLRGAVFYGPILTGRSSGNPASSDSGTTAMTKLYPFFAPAPPADLKPAGQQTPKDPPRKP